MGALKLEQLCPHGVRNVNPSKGGHDLEDTWEKPLFSCASVFLPVKQSACFPRLYQRHENTGESPL